jgi:DNA-binding transcriptional MerR regulator
MDDRLLMTQDAALILKKSPETVRLYVRTGKLAAKRTPSGRRLYSELEVRALATSQAAKASKPAICDASKVIADN